MSSEEADGRKGVERCAGCAVREKLLNRAIRRDAELIRLLWKAM